MSYDIARQLSELAGKIDLLYLKIDQLELAVREGSGQDKRDVKDPLTNFTGMSAKQHAVLQMLMNGRTTSEMASRLGVSDSTVKQHIKLIGRRVGLPRRQQIVGYFTKVFHDMNDRQYQIYSDGLPKSWDDTWGEGGEQYDHLVKRGEH